MSDRASLVYQFLLLMDLWASSGVPVSIALKSMLSHSMTVWDQVGTQGVQACQASSPGNRTLLDANV